MPRLFSSRRSGDTQFKELYHIFKEHETEDELIGQLLTLSDKKLGLNSSSIFMSFDEAFTRNRPSINIAYCFKEWDKKNILHLVCYCQYAEALRYLIKNHRQTVEGLINSQDRLGNTPLILALKGKYMGSSTKTLEICKLLIDNYREHLDLTIMTNHNETALECAAKGDYEFFRYISSALGWKFDNVTTFHRIFVIAVDNWPLDAFKATFNDRKCHILNGYRVSSLDDHPLSAATKRIAFDSKSTEDLELFNYTCSLLDGKVKLDLIIADLLEAMELVCQKETTSHSSSKITRWYEILFKHYKRDLHFDLEIDFGQHTEPFGYYITRCGTFGVFKLFLDTYSVVDSQMHILAALRMDQEGKKIWNYLMDRFGEVFEPLEPQACEEILKRLVDKYLDCDDGKKVDMELLEFYIEEFEAGLSVDFLVMSCQSAILRDNYGLAAKFAMKLKVKLPYRVQLALLKRIEANSALRGGSNNNAAVRNERVCEILGCLALVRANKIVSRSFLKRLIKTVCKHCELTDRILENLAGHFFYEAGECYLTDCSFQNGELPLSPRSVNTFIYCKTVHKRFNLLFLKDRNVRILSDIPIGMLRQMAYY